MGRPRDLFAYRLAAHMGTADVAGLMQSMSPAEFDEWWAASLTGRLDDGWAQAAMVCAVMVNVMREVAAGFAGVRLKESDMVTPDMYMPTLGSTHKETPSQSSQEVNNLGKMLAAKFTGAGL